MEDNFLDENINIDQSIKEINNNNQVKDNNSDSNNSNKNENENETKPELVPKNNEQKEKVEKIENKNNKQEKEKKDVQKDYKQMAKDYITQGANDEEYANIIKSDPMSLFDSIDEKKLDNWETHLSSICPLTFQMTNEKDKKILECPPSQNIKQKTVISNDSKRTRVRESVIYPNFIETLEKVLTFYCEKYQLIYKQGLNEIFGPLILMKYKLKNVTLTSIINLGAMIIDTFLPNYFYEKEIYSLKSALGLFVVLLKYHEPTVYNKLDTLEIRPEIYATNWLVTYISGKISLNNFFYLWGKMINIEDPLFIQFMLLAIIKDKRELILNCDSNLLATMMTSLSIRTKKELDKIIETAYELREQTPYSFRLLADKIGFLKKKYSDIKKNYEKYQPELLPAMPIFPSEVLYITYKPQIFCIDPNCKNYATDFALNRKIVSRMESRTIVGKCQTINFTPNVSTKTYSNVEKHYLCEKCDLGIEKNMQYILLDLRILEYSEDEDDTDKTGFLPSMISVSQEELKSEDFSDIMTNRFITSRGTYHFIFLTSSTDTFTDFESNYYMDNISEEDRKKMMFGIIEQKKIDKELDINNAKKKLSLKQIYKLKEYDNMRNTLKSMTKHNFPYVGYVYGGFNNVHKEFPKFKVELINHNEELCLLCNQDKNKENKKEEEDNAEKDELYKALWEHKQKIKYKNLDVFFKNPNNKMHLCVLKEYKKKDIEYGQVQILINELFDKYEIEIYKFDKKKQYDDFESTVLIMKKKEKQEYYDYGKEEDDNNKDLELTLLERVPVFDILTIKPSPKAKNVVICEIRGEQKKAKFFSFFKKENNSFETISIVFDFSSTNDAKNFVNSFKDLITKYKESLKKKK